MPTRSPGRPHALRVDARYLDDPELLGSFAQLANTTHADARPAGAWQATGWHPTEVSRVESALAGPSKARRRRVADCRGCWWPAMRIFATGFDVVHDARAATDLQSQLPPSLETFCSARRRGPALLRTDRQDETSLARGQTGIGELSRPKNGGRPASPSPQSTRWNEAR